MSLFKKTKSNKFYWKRSINGRRYRKSTRQVQRHLALKVAAKWDLMLLTGDLSFLNQKSAQSSRVDVYVPYYLGFCETRQSEKTIATATGILDRLLKFLKEKKVKQLDEINVALLNEYVVWLSPLAPKTIKNHIGAIGRMLSLAVDEEVLTKNVAQKVKLPKMISEDRHRLLEPQDLKLIFTGANEWLLYYSFLLFTGLRAGDVSSLKFSHLDFERRVITAFIRKSQRTIELPLADRLIELLPDNDDTDAPIFPELFSENETALNGRLRKPRVHMQSLLAEGGREKATLHSFRTTFNNLLRDQGLAIEDRRTLMGHSASKTTAVYGRQNLELAAGYINRLPKF